MHGGASTGPRTAEGRARVAAANTKHGGYDAETAALLRQMRRLRAEAADLVARHFGRQRRRRATTINGEQP